MNEPLLGPGQSFPQRCADCGERFRAGERITMRPALREGDVISLGRWPAGLRGAIADAREAGRVLWYMWLCEACVLPELELEYQQREAERQLNRDALSRARGRRQWPRYGT